MIYKLLPEKAALIRQIIEPPPNKTKETDMNSKNSKHPPKQPNASTTTHPKTPKQPPPQSKTPIPPLKQKVAIEDLLKPNPNHEKKNTKKSSDNEPKPKKDKKKQNPTLTEEEIKECDRKAQEYSTRRRLARMEVPAGSNSVDAAVGSIPVCKNKYGQLEDMDAEETPRQPNAFDWTAPPSWDDEEGDL